MDGVEVVDGQQEGGPAGGWPAGDYTKGFLLVDQGDPAPQCPGFGWGFANADPCYAQDQGGGPSFEVDARLEQVHESEDY